MYCCRAADAAEADGTTATGDADADADADATAELPEDAAVKAPLAIDMADDYGAPSRL